MRVSTRGSGARWSGRGVSVGFFLLISVFVAVAAAAGCTGSIEGGVAAGPGGGGSESSGSGSGTSVAPGPVEAISTDGVTTFTCNAKQQPAMDQLRSLTNRQYLNTLTDLLTSKLGSEDASAVLQSAAVSAALSLLPPSTPTIPQPLLTQGTVSASTAAAVTNANALAGAFPDGGWLRADQSIQQARVSAFYSIGLALAQVLSSSQYLGTLVGNCALGEAGATDLVCLNGFITGFGSRVLRVPLEPSDPRVATYTAFFNLNGPDSTQTNPAASEYQDVLTGLFNAPEFLYFVEHGNSNAPVANLNGVYTLSANELASRLSYQVWDTAPDDELWAKVVDGSLLQPSVYAAEVARLFADPRAQQTLDLFFTDYFQAEARGGPRGTGGLNYHNLADPNVLASVQFKAFAESDLPTASLFTDMLADALGTVDYLSWSSPGTIHDLMTTGESFAETADVAHLYGLKAWDGKSKPPAFPSNQRPGLFTRALFTSAGLDTSPILKGVYFRRYVLCDTLGPPPAAAMGKFVPVTTNETTRQATTQLTDNPPCSGCHTEWINPLGFPTESFDGLGRFRTEETLFNTNGTVATKLPIDTAVTPYVMMADGTTKAADAADLMNIADSTNKPAACLARNYFRYSFARFEDVSVDGCALEQMRQTLDGDGPLADLWKSVVETPAFQQRTFQ